MLLVWEWIISCYATSSCFPLILFIYLVDHLTELKCQKYYNIHLGINYIEYCAVSFYIDGDTIFQNSQSNLA